MRNKILKDELDWELIHAQREVNRIKEKRKLIFATASSKVEHDIDESVNDLVKQTGLWLSPEQTSEVSEWLNQYRKDQIQRAVGEVGHRDCHRTIFQTYANSDNPKFSGYLPMVLNRCYDYFGDNGHYHEFPELVWNDGNLTVESQIVVKSEEEKLAYEQMENA